MQATLNAIKADGGFMSMAQLDEIAKHDRLRMILVRCGNGRFQCPAQDVRHFVRIIGVEGTDHVRDISLPTTDPIWR